MGELQSLPQDIARGGCVEVHCPNPVAVPEQARSERERCRGDWTWTVKSTPSQPLLLFGIQLNLMGHSIEGFLQRVKVEAHVFVLGGAICIL